ncbi:MAG: nucleotide exchange factor GrpE, partial [Actinomycetes bacterium]
AEVAEADVPFDPNVHEAVMHDDGESDSGPQVVEVLRTGYLWHQRTLRAAMVRVRG